MPDDLTELPVEELIQQMHDDLYDGMAEDVEAEVDELLRRGWTPYEALTKGLVGGMD
ncbi:MAG: cobalamin-binding protein, partial [Anaerolineales bacterium]